MNPTLTRNVIILFLIIGEISAKLIISHTTETKSVGDYLSVLCKEENGATVTWKGPRNRIYGETTNPFVKITMHGVHLIFKKLKLSDSGVYTCKSEHGETMKYVLEVVAQENFDFEEIDPIEPPVYSKPTIIKPRPIYFTTYRPRTSGPSSSPKKEQIRFVDTPTTVTGSEGSDIFLKCDASGSDEIEWSVDGEVVPKDGPKYQATADGLLIKNASPEDSDKVYDCKAIAVEAGNFEVRTINVTVTHKPRPKYERENVVFGYINGYVNLTCDVEAVPAPTFRWLYKKTKNAGYKRIGKEVTSNEETPTTSVLMLYLNEDSFGEYKCIASNSEGEIDIDFSLKEGTQPRPPTNIEVLNVTSNEVYLTIEEPEVTAEENTTGMYPTAIRVTLRQEDESYWENWEFELDYNKLYIIRNLTEETTYMVLAATKNAAGLSEYVNVTFTTTASPSSSANVVSSLGYLYIILLIYFKN
ncbi:hemicentin-1 isoform X1 [Anthonomus grandis grandis]|uniref:hemicentin-1 isoform X1 n=1 Tax=Anthonomus grandis grandis TaxID=2921223 RepID=UPI00216565D3|nr:hemicentin-1 isoform X1 [Anthonomus grandis grandis]